MAGDDQEPQELQRVTVLGMLDGDGQNNVVLHLFPSAISRVIVAVEWAKAHPEAEHIKIVLHGEKPDAVVMTMPRTALLVMAADMVMPTGNRSGTNMAPTACRAVPATKHAKILA